MYIYIYIYIYICNTQQFIRKLDNYRTTTTELKKERKKLPRGDSNPRQLQDGNLLCTYNCLQMNKANNMKKKK